MYSTTTRYKKTTDTTLQTVYNGTDLNKYTDKHIKAVFLTNGTEADLRVSCYIRTSDGLDYYIFPKNMMMEAGDSQSAIQKALPLNDGDMIMFQSTKAGAECSVIIDYDSAS